MHELTHRPLISTLIAVMSMYLSLSWIVIITGNRTHTRDLEESVQHEPVVNNFPDFPGAKPPSTTSPPPPQCTIDAVIEESPPVAGNAIQSPPVAGNAIQTMAEIMKASLKETEKENSCIAKANDQKETEKDNSHAQQNDNITENEIIPLDDTEIIFATYDIARDTRQQALEPCDYEDPVSIMGNKSGKNKVLASYEYASGKKSAFDRSLEMGGVTAPTPKPRKGLDRGWSARK